MGHILDPQRWPTMPLAFCAVRQAGRKWEKAGRSYLTQRNRPLAGGAAGENAWSINAVTVAVALGGLDQSSDFGRGEKFAGARSFLPGSRGNGRGDASMSTRASAVLPIAR
jgi:hypothetical protein